MSAPYPDGIDLVWLASDRDGHVGAFVTAGVGPVPALALEPAHIPIEDVEVRLCQLPVVSEALMLVSVKRPDDFRDLAQRGLFVYDWTDVHRSSLAALRAYEPVAAPAQPINANTLPLDLLQLASALNLPDMQFTAGVPVDIESIWTCAQPST